MSNKKISQLIPATNVTVNDLFQVIDVEDLAMASSGTNKKVTAQTLGNSLPVQALGSTASRMLSERFSETINVKDFGAIGDGITDDTAAIQSAVNSNLNFIYFPKGSYKVTATITVSTSKSLTGAGIWNSVIRQATPNIDTFLFKPITAGTTSDFLNNVLIEGLQITHTDVVSTSTSGAGIRFLQCNNYKLFQVVVNNAPQGITIQGGQFGSLKSFAIYVANGLAPTTNTALLYFRQAPVGAGFQSCYTVNVEDFHLSASLLRQTCILIQNADGLNFINGYIANGDYSLVQVRAERDNSYVAAVSFNGVYLDCVGTAKTRNGVAILEDGFANSFVYQFRIGSGCTIGNGDEIGVLCTKIQTRLLSIEGTNIINMKSWGIYVAGDISNHKIQIADCQFESIGSATTGAIGIAGCKSVVLTGNIFDAITNLVLNISGSVGRISINGNSNNSNISDIANSSTSRAYLSGNSSALSAFSANSWVTNNSFFVDQVFLFPSIAVGSYADVAVNVPRAKLNDVCQVNYFSGTFIEALGNGALLLYSAGVSSNGVVTVRAVNLGSAGSLGNTISLNIAIISK